MTYRSLFVANAILTLGDHPTLSKYRVDFCMLARMTHLTR
jgi:hypothetical protein